MARRGWPLVAALATAQLVSWGSVYYEFSLFVVPMERELGWSRTALNGALSLGLLASGLWAYPIGAWIDRRGGRAVMTAGSLLAALLLAFWSRVHGLLEFYAIWLAFGLVLAATLYDPVFVVLTRRFPGDYRTRITALTLVGGFASTVFIPLTQLFIDRLGWRDALLALALCNLAIPLPVHALLLRDRETAPAMRGTASPDESGALRRALRQPAFWGLALCFTGYYAAFLALTFHLVPMLAARGFPSATIVGALAVVGPAQVAGRIALLGFRRGFPIALAGGLATLLFPLSVLVLIALPSSTGALFVFAALYGGGNGILTILRGTAVPDLLGSEGYGAINGALGLPTNVAKGVAPLGAAAIWSLAGNDAVLWSALAGGMLAAVGFWLAVLAARIRREPAPATAAVRAASRSSPASPPGARTETPLPR
ncbi:MAG TPA: MFS transporter [Stellaceae bacterium]|nr:MFS transporter [Stellaceae bacterium]